MIYTFVMTPRLEFVGDWAGHARLANDSYNPSTLRNTGSTLLMYQTAIPPAIIPVTKTNIEYMLISLINLPLHAF